MVSVTAITNIDCQCHGHSISKPLAVIRGVHACDFAGKTVESALAALHEDMHKWEYWE